ncbi:hypothetical protein [Sulfurimonas sp.]|uniref:hypothetical protein n=1 Tax=Sulfurimonas sp. TaxID=2022749 RepID=UPI003565F094
MKITILTSIVFAFILGGCSYFTFNATMCDQIASDPHATIPKECRVYNEEEAEKAFHKTDKTKLKDEESVEFNK